VPGPDAAQSCRLEKAFLIDVVSKLYIASDSSPVDMQVYELCADMIDVAVDISCIYGAPDELNPLAYDEHSRAVIRLSNGMVLCLREMTRCGGGGRGRAAGG
jgi:Ras-related GTP-binding protein C/D